MYSNDHCPFCLGELVVGNNDDGYYYCNNDCDSAYSIVSFSGGTFSANFYIGSYKFYVNNVRTTITEIAAKTRSTITIDEPMIVNHQNKFKILKRISKLQAFA